MTAKITVDSRQDLRDLYTSIFETFSLHPEVWHDDGWPWTPAYTRQMLSTLVKSGLVVTEEAEDDTYYQSFRTYDDITLEEALAFFDQWFDNNATSIEGNSTMSSTASPGTKVKPDANTPCYCGCGGKTRSFYMPGHDARHAGNIGRLVAQDTLAGESEPERHYSDLPSDRLVAKAKKIADTAIAKANKSTKTEEPAYVDGIVKVGKNEYAAKRYQDGSVHYFKPGVEGTQIASKTAAKTFQEG